MESEIWLPVLGLRDCGYEISNRGRIRSWRRGNREDCGGGRVMITRLNSTGYESISLRLHRGSKVKRNYMIHSLVARTFMTPVDGRECVNHKDGDRLNNDLQNLEFCTIAENNWHAKETGLANDRGHNSVLAKWTEQDVKRIRRMRENGATYAKIREKFPMAKSTLSYIVNSKTYCH